MRWGSRHGWIGLDVGRRAVKVAQLARRGDRFALVSASLALRGAADDETPLAVADSVRAARTLAGGLRGVATAATLSMDGMCVEATDPDQACDAGACHGRWQAGPASDYTLSVPASRVEALVEGAARAGLQCDVVDGPPLALARVLRWTDGYNPRALWGVLDWGESAVTFIAATDGTARYARRLAGGGFDDFATAVGHSLGTTPAEAARLLRRKGVEPPPFTSGEQRVLSDAARHAARGLVTDLQRSLEHLGGKLRTPPPERIFVTGAGGAVPGLAGTIGAALGLRCEPWRADRLERAEEVAEVPDCLLGQAIALSALAWDT